MKARQLLNLPLGKYELTDGIYDYSLSKEPAKHYGVIYMIRDKINANNKPLALFELLSNRHGKIFEFDRLILSANAGIGALSIASDDTSLMLEPLAFIPRGSFKKFIELTS